MHDGEDVEGALRSSGLSPQAEGEPDGAAASLDWAEVKAAYELSGASVASILKRFGLTPHRLRQQRTDENWTTRPPVARPGALQGRKPIGSEAVELRLNRLVVIGVAMLEKRLAEEGLNEANARTLTELCRAEEYRMRSTRQKTGKTRETKNDAGYDFRDDPAWLDAEIRRRIANLSRDQETRGAAGEDPGGEAHRPGGLAK